MSPPYYSYALTVLSSKSISSLRTLVDPQSLCLIQITVASGAMTRRSFELSFLRKASSHEIETGHDPRYLEILHLKHQILAATPLVLTNKCDQRGNL